MLCRLETDDAHDDFRSSGDKDQDTAGFKVGRRRADDDLAGPVVGRYDGSPVIALRHDVDLRRLVRSENRIFDFVGLALLGLERAGIAEGDLQLFGGCGFRNRDRTAVVQGKDYFVIGLFHFLEYAVGFSRFSRIPFFSRRLAELCPGGSVVIGDVPIVVFDLQLRGDAVLPGPSLPARLSFAAFGPDPFAGGIRQPVAVEGPVVDAVGILSDTDDRCGAVFSGFPVRTGLSVLAVVDGDRIALGEGDRVADRCTVLVDRYDAGDVILFLKRLDEGLQGGNVGIHLLAEFLQPGYALFQPRLAAPQVAVVVFARRDDDGRHLDGSCL